MPDEAGSAASAVPAPSSGRPRFGFLGDPRVSVSATILVVLLFATIFAGVVAPYDPNRQYLGSALLPPSLTPVGAGEFPHLAGTDHLGRDVLSRVLHGGRISFVIGIVTALVAAVAGTVVGVVSGYFAGPAGRILMRFADQKLTYNCILTAFLELLTIFRFS